MEAVGRAAPGFARGGRGSVLSFLSEKEKKEPKKRNPNGEGMHGSRRVSRTRLCARRKGAAFFLFFQKKSERTREQNP